MKEPAKVQTVVREVIEESGLPRTLIAQDANVSRASIIAWLAGTRIPQPESVAQLADGLEKRAKLIQAQVARLRKLQ